MSKKIFRVVQPVLWAVALSAAVQAAEDEPVSAFERIAEQCPSVLSNIQASPVGWAQVREFYQRQADQPLWQDVARVEQLSELFEELRYDGLQPEQYAVPTQPAQHLCEDVHISHRYLQALYHLRNGVTVQAKVEPYWVEPEAQLQARQSVVDIALLGVSDLPRAFIEARPQHVVYWQLREQLRQGEWLAAKEWPHVSTQGPSLRIDAVDSRVPALRQRLQQSGYLPEMHTALPVLPVDDDSALFELTDESLPAAVNPQQYDVALVEAVKAFQRDFYLEDDGIVGPATLRELNVSPARRAAQIRANLERFRWFEKYLEPEMLVVDIAGARLLYLQDGQVVWRTRTQVGTVRRQTPLLKSRITHLTINPTWTVPPTIFREDKLPAIRRDIGYLARSRLQVLNSSGQVLDPAQVDWSAPSGVFLRQAAGPSNALGRVAVRFANPFSVYLHDTPNQHLFGRSVRTVSSGCVRVEDAQQLVDLFFTEPAERARVASIQASGHTRQVNLPQPVPVLLAYWTVEVDADGRLRFRPDSYQHDLKVVRALEAL